MKTSKGMDDRQWFFFCNEPSGTIFLDVLFGTDMFPAGTKSDAWWRALENGV